MNPPTKAVARIPASIWALGFVSLLMDVSSELIHSLLPVFMFSALGMSVLTIGLIEGAAEATALIVKIFSGALSDYWGKRKPLAVLTARLTDRVGKGIRGAPRDALVADLAPPELRGASFGLRQSLDTIGAFLGPLLAMGLMLLWANDFRTVFWVATVPAFLSVALLFFVREPERRSAGKPVNPIRRENLRRLSPAYWWVVGIGAVFTLARFSEAFLVLRAQQGGLPLALTPLVLIGMNVVYSVSAYPFGKLSDSRSHSKMLAWGLGLLIGADAALAYGNQGVLVWGGIALWGLHMGMTQGLLATMVADTAPADLRGTAFGFFNLVSGLGMLLASAIAGLLWDQLGASFTFLASGVFSALALVAILLRRGESAVAEPRPTPRA
jgi:MFS family permease